MMRALAQNLHGPRAISPLLDTRLLRRSPRRDLIFSMAALASFYTLSVFTFSEGN